MSADIATVLSRTDANDLVRKDAEIMRLKSALISLLTLAEAKDSPLTNHQVAVICRHVLDYTRT